MKAYSVLTPFNYSQKSIVVAESMGKAEEAFRAAYPGIKIVSIELVSEYVIISGKFS